ncbi:hypothetical protein EOE18_03385 [Novosphingobium umbonatum]|uniref:Uncharacterized protein n=1 Tax=Novosphingobium umbonatum TaxID=1908524 RepID=A0A3S2X6P1_9SPHN|nr:hypothetical protein [Novosphingobium umbonatum]RVU07012.1 hypothetical protein EOE18_03385 [Novosphingobium umbonatum]
MTAKGQAKPITDADVQSWLGYRAEHEARFPLSHLHVEFARKELGRRLVGAKGYPSFSRRLFIDLCCKVTDACAFAVNEQAETFQAFPAKEARRKLEDLTRAASALKAYIDALGPEERSLLIYNYRDGPRRRGRWLDELPALEDLLDTLASDAGDAAGAADKLVKIGKAKFAPLTHLINHVGIALAGHAIPLGAKETGALHAYCALVLKVPEYREVFGDPKALRVSIKKALKKKICNPSIIGLPAMGYR